MKSGVFYGNVALIDGMLDKIEEEMGQKLTIIADWRAGKGTDFLIVSMTSFWMTLCC